MQNSLAIELQLDSTGRFLTWQQLTHTYIQKVFVCTGRPRTTRIQAPPADTPELRTGTLKGKS